MPSTRLVKLEMEGVLPLLGDVKAVRLLIRLSHNPARYTELLDGIGSKTLSRKLRLLERHSLITRTPYAEIPPRVVYTITEKGREFVSIVEGVLRWEQSWVQE